MSKEARDRVWAAKGFGGSQKLLLLALAEHADPSGVCWPGTEILLEKIDLSEVRFRKVLKELEEGGKIFSTATGGRKKGGYGTGNYSRYFVTVGLSKEQIAAVLTNHPKMEFDPETANLIASDVIQRVSNPTPLNRQQRVSNLTTKGVVFDNLRVSNPTNKGVENDTHNNKVEPKENRKEEPKGEGSAREFKPSPPPESCSSYSLISAAICEVSGSNPLRLSPRNFEGLKRSTAFLASLPDFKSEEALAAEVRRRYAVDVWPLDEPPNPSQIETHWFKQELILKKRENQNANTNDAAERGRRLRALAYSNPRN